MRVPLGCFNLHASLLPRWRGAAPINRAIMAGDAESGVTVMKMDEGLDTGAMAMIERVPIGADMTAGELHDALARLGADLMARAMGALERGALQFTPQPSDGVTYASKIDKAETRIDWSKPWKAVHDHIRGLSPFPGAWCEMAGAGRVKVLRTTKGEGSGTPGTVLDERLDDRLRRRRGAHRRIAEGRRQADEGRRIPARHAGCGRNGARMSGVPALRQERADDAARVRALLVDAFGGPVEADLVDKLRAAGDLVLALVAELPDAARGLCRVSRG